MHNFKPSELLSHLANKTPLILLMQSFFVVFIVLIYNFLSFNHNHLKQKEITFQIKANANFFDENPFAVKELYSELIFNEASSELGLDDYNYSVFYKNLNISNVKDGLLSLNNQRNVDEIYNAYFSKGNNSNKSNFYDELIRQITKIKPQIYNISYNLDKNNILTINQLVSLLSTMNEKINKRSHLLYENYEIKNSLSIKSDMITIASKILHLKKLLENYSENNFLSNYFDKNLKLIEFRFSDVIQSDLNQKINHSKAYLKKNDNLNDIHKDLIALDKQAKELFYHYDFKPNETKILKILSPIEYVQTDSLIRYKKIRDIIILSFNFFLILILYFIFTFFRKKSI